jgi:hypothetical protein
MLHPFPKKLSALYLHWDLISSSSRIVYYRVYSSLKAECNYSVHVRTVQLKFEIPAEHLLIPSDCRTRGIYTRADVCHFSFFPHTIITWNSIPPQVRQASRISTKLCMILYIRTVLAFACLCSRDSHFRCTVSALGSRSWELLETNRAALSCTESVIAVGNNVFILTDRNLLPIFDFQRHFLRCVIFVFPVKFLLNDEASFCWDLTLGATFCFLQIWTWKYVHIKSCLHLVLLAQICPWHRCMTKYAPEWTFSLTLNFQNRIIRACVVTRFDERLKTESSFKSQARFYMDIFSSSNL